MALGAVPDGGEGASVQVRGVGDLGPLNDRLPRMSRSGVPGSRGCAASAPGTTVRLTPPHRGSGGQPRDSPCPGGSQPHIARTSSSAADEPARLPVRQGDRSHHCSIALDAVPPRPRANPASRHWSRRSVLPKAPDADLPCRQPRADINLRMSCTNAVSSVRPTSPSLRGGGRC